jgi:hypothetical protein
MEVALWAVIGIGCLELVSQLVGWRVRRQSRSAPFSDETTS